MTPGLGSEPGPHWWEVIALTTAPSLLPQNNLGALELQQIVYIRPQNNGSAEASDFH